MKLLTLREPGLYHVKHDQAHLSRLKSPCQMDETDSLQSADRHG